MESNITNLGKLDFTGLGNVDLTGLEDAIDALGVILGDKGEALQQKHVLRSELNSLKTEASSGRKPCPFLDKFSFDIRKIIYEELLVNEVLSTPNSVIRNQKFDLDVEVLRTCRKICEEATPILYGSNTFYVNLLSRTCYLSPITRYFDSLQPRRSWSMDALTEVCLKTSTVKKWKVILGRELDSLSYGYADGEQTRTMFVRFVRVLSLFSPLSLAIEVIPLPEGHDNFFMSSNVQHHLPLADQFHPLRLLRNLMTFELKCAELSSLPDWWCYDIMGLMYKEASITWDKIPESLVKDLKAVMMGDSPVYRVFQMLEALMGYCQLFERCEVFRESMWPTYAEATYDQRRKAATGQPQGQLIQHQSPFKEDPYHPVEEALGRAVVGTETNDWAEFSEYRKVALDYLEPQYQRIVKASRVLADFIKENKKFFCIYENGFATAVSRPSTDRSEYLPYRAFILLEEYADSFKREMPQFTREHVLSFKPDFDINYDILPREMNLKALKSLLQHKLFDRRFCHLFKLAFDDMDEQYLAIRKARRTLFDFDFCHPGCDIDPEKWRYDGKVVWDVLEPVILTPEVLWFDQLSSSLSGSI